MIASMFNLDDRLAELRPSEDELRLARHRREADLAPTRAAGTGTFPRGRANGRPSLDRRPSRAAAG